MKKVWWIRVFSALGTFFIFISSVQFGLGNPAAGVSVLGPALASFGVAVTFARRGKIKKVYRSNKLDGKKD